MTSPAARPVPGVDVVVPVLNGAGVLGACLDGLAAQRADIPALQVWVVDNGSTDATARLAAAHPVVTAVLHEPRRGSYAARNRGVAAGDAPVVAFTDADCIPRPGWLRSALAQLDADADLVAGRIVQRRSADPGVWERYDCAFYLRQDDNVEHLGFGATANLVVRRAVLDALGGFRPELQTGGDVELCRRAAAGGRRLVYAADALVEHRPRSTPAATWALWRRLGAGAHQSARRGQWPPAWRDPLMRWPLGYVVERVAADGPALRRRHLAAVHAVAMAARWTGRVTGR